MWFSWGRSDIEQRLNDIDARTEEILPALHRIEGRQMTQNDELTAIKELLVEASTEVPAKIDELLAAVEAGQPVDPALVAEIKALSQGLADIVPNAPVEPDPNPVPEPEPAPE